MDVIFLAPKITMRDCKNAEILYNRCIDQLNEYISDIIVVKTNAVLDHLIDKSFSQEDILIFFNSDCNEYSQLVLRFINKCNQAKCDIWPIAMKKENRKPPEIVSDKQSFDIPSLTENRSPLKDNLSAVAQILSRKVIARMLSPYYRDEVQYFISHRRADGEHIAARISDKLIELNRGHKVYRDVVNVSVGEDAQKDIDENLAQSDVLIFIQTPEAGTSSYIEKELIYAIINDIPVLWIQIDDAPYNKLPIAPGKCPLLSYHSADFDKENIQDIIDEIENNCFKLIMFSSNQICTYLDYMRNLRDDGLIEMIPDQRSHFSYSIRYNTFSADKYVDSKQYHYIRCFGRNPNDIDVTQLAEYVKRNNVMEDNKHVFLISRHGKMEKRKVSETVINCDNYEEYINNLQRNCGRNFKKRFKKIIISGSFPDHDEIYNASLMEAMVVYCREIIKRGYTLVFGAHPTFQKLIFEAAAIFSPDVCYSVEMHMDKAYLSEYDVNELNNKCTLILSNGLEEMRNKMISLNNAELLICLGGKIKADKSLQGVDIEINLAKEKGIPIALVGSVGGRSGEYAREVEKNNIWDLLNNFPEELNKDLLCNVNHRLMIDRLLDAIEKNIH